MIKKTKHPSSRYERLRIKEIKDEIKSTGQPGRLRRRAQEIEAVKEFDHAVLREQIREEEIRAE